MERFLLLYKYSHDIDGDLCVLDDFVRSWKGRQMSTEGQIYREKIFLTSAQAAEFLNVSLATLKKYIVIGKIRAIRTPGGHYRIKRQDLLEKLYD